MEYDNTLLAYLYINSIVQKRSRSDHGYYWVYNFTFRDGTKAHSFLNDPLIMPSAIGEVEVKEEDCVYLKCKVAGNTTWKGEETTKLKIMNRIFTRGSIDNPIDMPDKYKMFHKLSRGVWKIAKDNFTLDNKYIPQEKQVDWKNLKTYTNFGDNLIDVYSTLHHEWKYMNYWKDIDETLMKVME